MPDSVAVSQMNDLLVQGDRLTCVPPEMLGGELIPGPDLIKIHRVEDALKFGLPLSALIGEFHVFPRLPDCLAQRS